jgi:hypothetical protein
MVKMSDTELYTPGKVEKAEVAALADSKYRTWEWNYGYGPAYRFINRFKFRDINHCCDLNIKDGLVSTSRITGSALLESPGRDLSGMRHHYPDFASYFESIFPGEGNELAYRFF